MHHPRSPDHFMLRFVDDRSGGISNSKQSTDKAYNDAIALLISRLASDLRTNPQKTPSVGVYFGTHNWDSCRLIAKKLEDEGLASRKKGDNGEEGRLALNEGVRGRVAIGQLYG